MYIGRFLVVGPDGGTYRVSSRSYPNRRIVEDGDALAVVPTADAPETTNPYIAYHCYRAVEPGAVLGNGSHVDPIAEKLALGYPARDALAAGLLNLDYEKDEYDTPRIAGVIGRHGNADGPRAHIGIVRRDALLVRAVGRPTLIATYEYDEPRESSLPTAPADRAARAAYDAEYDHPVCAAGVAAVGADFETAIVNDGSPVGGT